MVRISQNVLDESVRNRLYDDLVELFIANSTKREFSTLLSQILSPAERTMLAKRVGIIGALTCNCSIREIKSMFNVSTSTVWRIQEQMEKGSLDYVVAIFKQKRGRARLLHTIEQLFELGVNPQRKLRKQLRRDISKYHAGGNV